MDVCISPLPDRSAQTAIHDDADGNASLSELSPSAEIDDPEFTLHPPPEDTTTPRTWDDEKVALLGSDASHTLGAEDGGWKGALVNVYSGAAIGSAYRSVDARRRLLLTRTVKSSLLVAKVRLWILNSTAWSA